MRAAKLFEFVDNAVEYVWRLFCYACTVDKYDVGVSHVAKRRMQLVTDENRTTVVRRMPARLPGKALEQFLVEVAAESTFGPSTIQMCCDGMPDGRICG
jgi:hypothetical protein